MIHIKPGKLIVFAPAASALKVPARSKITHVVAAHHLFPAIQQEQPDAVIFDYTHAGPELERMLRRLKTNVFYKRIKVYCYKAEWHTRTDSFLQTLGVDYFIYADELAKQVDKRQSAFTGLSNILEKAVMSTTLTEPSF